MSRLDSDPTKARKVSDWVILRVVELRLTVLVDRYDSFSEGVGQRFEWAFLALRQDFWSFDFGGLLIDPPAVAAETYKLVLHFWLLGVSTGKCLVLMMNDFVFLIIKQELRAKRK